jgi:hypothetical protein
MSKLNFLFFPCHNTGGHFVIWSLYHLSGQTHYEINKFKNHLNPVAALEDFKTIKNAHIHHCDRIHGFKECQQLASQPKLTDNYHVYTNFLFFPDVLVNKFNTNVVDATQEQRDHVFNIVHEDTQRMINYIQDYHKLVLVDFDQGDWLNSMYNNRYPVDHNRVHIADYDEYMNQYESVFFPNAHTGFDQNNTWDRREKTALIFKIQPKIDWSTMVNKQKPNALYTTDDVWNDLPNVITEMLEYLDLQLLSDRLPAWKELYNTWREKHDNHFSRCFNRIIQAIVNGEYMCLKRFNLNFYKEALIQHALITQHNLNLRTWQLEQFPTNTQDIHLLLEPNTHII